jgi:excisionase family DNA binding protein
VIAVLKLFKTGSATFQNVLKLRLRLPSFEIFQKLFLRIGLSQGLFIEGPMYFGSDPGVAPMESENTSANVFETSDTKRVEELLTIDELAALLKVPKSWIYERTRRRGAERLPYIKLGKYLRFEEGAIRAYLNRNCKAA